MLFRKEITDGLRERKGTVIIVKIKTASMRYEDVLVLPESYWYEIGDVICIGDARIQYYCFPQDCGDIVAKARLAAEELYKLVKAD